MPLSKSGLQKVKLRLEREKDSQEQAEATIEKVASIKRSGWLLGVWVDFKGIPPCPCLYEAPLNDISILSRNYKSVISTLVKITEDGKLYVGGVSPQIFGVGVVMGVVPLFIQAVEVLSDGNQFPGDAHST